MSNREPFHPNVRSVPVTAAELYAESPEFRGFVLSWVRRKRCPLPLVDFLLERGLESQAECARWCATEPARKDYHDEMVVRFPYPRHSFGNRYGWFSTDNLRDYDDIPVGRTELPNQEPMFFNGKTVAILTLLDAWKV